MSEQAKDRAKAEAVERAGECSCGKQMGLTDEERMCVEFGFDAGAEYAAWVPCSERLPRKGLTQYLVTVRSDLGSFIKRSTFSYEPVDVNDASKGFKPRWWNVKKGSEVIAWMPIPPPYTEDRTRHWR